MSAQPTGALADVLRTWRDRTDPATVGMARNSPRRAPGLRREELALLAGISNEYVVRLEQGRARTPSVQVCAALARALHLSDDEQAHLFRLAGHAGDTALVPRQIPASVRRIVDQLDGHPVVVCDAMWDLLFWNPLYAALCGDPSTAGPRDRNTLLRHFTGRPTRVRHSPEEERAFEVSMVADLRATTGRYPRDPDLAALVAELRRVPRFAELWDTRLVTTHEQSHKLVVHPEVGEVDIDCDVLASQGTDLRVVVFTPRPGTDARSKLDLLGALGMQALGAQP
ncbi:MAG: helix-turn-helix domain-containing protein [Pseudonocardia sp.]|nr:helix-turn-helix domain-containing protein [Pseudonocardia sp.]